MNGTIKLSNYMTIFSNISQPFEGKVLGNWAKCRGNSSTEIVATSAHHKKSLRCFGVVSTSFIRVSTFNDSIRPEVLNTFFVCLMSAENFVYGSSDFILKCGLSFLPLSAILPAQSFNSSIHNCVSRVSL